MRLDAVIFGGDVAGLWLLDRLSRDGHHVVLLESKALGAGQAVGSQAVLDGGRCVTSWRSSILGMDAASICLARVV